MDLTATLSVGLTSPYDVSIYDNTGALLECSWSSGTTSMSISVTLPSDGSQRTYTAYVAQGCPSPGPPTNDVRDSSSLTFVSNVNTSSARDGVDLEALATLAATRTDDQVEEVLITAPGTHFEGSSVSDQLLTYEDERAAGKSVSKALLIALGVGGGVATGVLAAYVWTQLNAQASPPAPPSTPGLPGPLPPPDIVPVPFGPEPTYEDDLTGRFLQRNPKLTVQQARTAAQECILSVQQAIGAGALPETINGEYPCDALPIYLPGSEYPATTQHDSDAIFGGSGNAGNLAWIKLNYVSQADRGASGLRPGWYSVLQSPCTGTTGKALGMDCDEYPFYSSAQSGPGANISPEPISQNRGAGNKYRYFASAYGCSLRSGGPVASTQGAIGSPFLVIPMAFAEAPPTMFVC